LVKYSQCSLLCHFEVERLKVVVTEPHIVQMSNSLELGHVSRF